jgi:excisionase family DNA binding protein
MTDQHWLTPRQVAERLQTSRDTTYGILASGLIRVARVGRGGRLLRVSEQALADYASRCESGGEDKGATGLQLPVALNGGLHAGRAHRRKPA